MIVNKENKTHGFSWNIYAETGSILAWVLGLNPGIGELLCVTVQFVAVRKGLCGNSLVCRVVLLQGAEKCKMWSLVCVDGLVYRTQALEEAIRTYTLPDSLLLSSWQSCMQEDGLTQLYASTISLKQWGKTQKQKAGLTQLKTVIQNKPFHFISWWSRFFCRSNRKRTCTL